MRPTICASFFSLALSASCLPSSICAPGEERSPPPRCTLQLSDSACDSSRSCSTRCACAVEPGAVALDVLAGGARAPAAPSGPGAGRRRAASRCRRCARSSSWRCVAGAACCRADRSAVSACASLRGDLVLLLLEVPEIQHLGARQDAFGLQQARASGRPAARSPVRRAFRPAPSAGAGSRSPAWPAVDR